MNSYEEITEEEARKEVGNWAYNLQGKDMDDALEQLELLKEGTVFTRMNRLLKRICANYIEEEFDNTGNEDEDISAMERRDNKLIDLLDRTSISESAKEIIRRRIQERSRSEGTALARPLGDSFIQFSSTESMGEEDENAHRLSYEQQNANSRYSNSNSDPLAFLANTIALVSTATTTTTITTTSSDNTPRLVYSTSLANNKPRMSAKTHKSYVEGNTTVTFASGRNIELPVSIAEEIYRREREYTQLKQQVAALANSTRINEGVNTAAEVRAAKSVNFQETFEMRYPEDCLNTTRSQLNPNARNFTYNAQNPPVSTGMSESGGGGYRPFASHPHDSGSWQTADRSFMQRPTDVGKLVRQWQVKFSGEKNSSIEEFIQRVNECRVLARIDDEDLLNSMTELLTGVALYWYRRSRDRWRTWDDFCVAARRCWGEDRRFQQRLSIEAQNRTQGKDEPVREYIICLLTIMSRFKEPLDLETQLDVLHRNMLPELQRLVRRSKVQDVDELLELARDAEALLDAERNYRPPPPPEQSLLPEVAYKTTKSKYYDDPNAPAVNASTLVESEVEILKQMNKQLMDLMQQFMKSTKEDSTEGQSNTARSQRRNSNDEDKTTRRFSRSPKPKSDRNKNKEPGPRAYAQCWECSWPGYIKYTCPECSGKEEGSA